MPLKPILVIISPDVKDVGKRKESLTQLLYMFPMYKVILGHYGL